MPAAPRASNLLLVGVAAVFVAGVAFGAVAAFTTRAPQVAKATDPATEQTPPATEPETTPPPPPPKLEPKKTEPTKKSEAKPPPKPEKNPEPAKPKPEPKPEPPKAEPISFEKQVFPIFKAKCVLCHGDPQKKADLDLRTLAKAVEGGSSGEGAVPGKPDKSAIWLSIADMSMPPAGKEKLTDTEKKLIKDWILSGAK